MPSVSIVVCNYNYAAFIEACLVSCIDQSVPAVEIIVVDDGSTDESRSLIEKYLDKVILIEKPNGGQTSAYNVGASRVRGDIVIFLDSDDLLDRCCIERILEAYDDNVVKYHWRMPLVNRQGEPTGSVIPNILDNGPPDIKKLQRGSPLFSSPGSGNAYARRFLERLLPIPEDAVDRHGADYFLVRAAAWIGTVKEINASLSYYRVHSEAQVDALVFGNAAKKTILLRKKRLERFNHWIAQRVPSLAPLQPQQEWDFSVEKQIYASEIFNDKGYVAGVASGIQLFPRLIKSIFLRPGGVASKIALSAWALTVLLLPRNLGFGLARYVCNPAGRTHS